jgi:hypothetical protein
VRGESPAGAREPIAAENTAKNLSIHAAAGGASGSGAASSKAKTAASRAVRRTSLQLKSAPWKVRLFLWLKLAWLSYLAALDTHPVMTKSLTAAFISILSDLLAQWLGMPAGAGKSFLRQVDWISVRNQAVIGFFVRGLPVHYWSMIKTAPSCLAMPFS